jgi:rubrerythrin
MFEEKKPIIPIPERRPFEKQARAYGISVETPAEKPSETPASVAKTSSEIKLKLWYCKQCGYVVFREDPPYICPICKAKREMFAEIEIRADMSK